MGFLAVRNQQVVEVWVGADDPGVPDARDSFQSTVENTIAPLLPHGKATAADVARQLGLSQRTFARRLSMEGITFSALLENLRSDLAGRYLVEGDMGVSEVAWLLGYREVGSFSHAFRRWTGKTPRQVLRSERRSRLEQPQLAQTHVLAPADKLLA
jgi:AraC-like DNA-binding protein